MATREPVRVNRLLSVLAEWFQIDIIMKTLSADSQSEAQVVFCRTSDDLQSGFSVSTDRLILVSDEADNERSPVIFSDSQYLLPALRRQELHLRVRGRLPPICEGEVLATCG
jgi:hypothetical protein